MAAVDGGGGDPILCWRRIKIKLSTEAATKLGTGIMLEGDDDNDGDDDVIDDSFFLAMT